ncbi:hypothetical protein NDN08_005740 [Rhodosorus marinus]|uniref:Ribophorin II n=1 Tax=Rhodosorus marinus TaxID=101924 RepID=A0AAV8V530_9RHOD|nr:hypothetical protein NDN08_005740 [Rhodosorus marinus]
MMCKIVAGRLSTIGILFLLLVHGVGGSTISLRKARLAITKIEKKKSVNVEAFGSKGWDAPPVSPQIILSEDHKMKVSMEFFDSNADSPVFPKQVFVRFRDNDSGEFADFITKKSGSSVLTDLPFQKFSAQEPELWRDFASFTMSILVGDVRMDGVNIWTVCEDVLFVYNRPESPPLKSAFDFDISVKKSLQPEFAVDRSSIVPTAPAPIVFLFCILTVTPFLGLIIVWSVLGALPPRVPASPSVGIFLLSLAAVLVVLIRFWLEWNIIQTAKWILFIMVPLLPSGFRALSLQKLERDGTDESEVAKKDE